MENNLITLVPQQVHAFIVNDQKGKYCVTLFPKGHFSAFPKNHVGFAPKNIKINTHKIEIDCQCGKPNAIENMIGCEGIKGKKLSNISKHRSCAGNKNLKGNTWYCIKHQPKPQT